MPLYMDIHRNVEGLTADAVADAHQKDFEVPGEHGVNYMRPGHNSSNGSEVGFESTIDLRLSLMAVEQSQLVDEHRPKSKAHGIDPALGGNLLVYIEDGLEVFALKFSLALLYATCGRFASPPPLSRCAGRLLVWR
jgi:hypothetical protein